VIVADPFELKIFFPQGDPDGVRTIKTALRTGQALYFPRDKWQEAKNQDECKRLGVYILGGNTELEDGTEDDLPTIYIGQSSDLSGRIDDHFKKKDFWDWGIIFSSASDDLNGAHAEWLEQAMINRAQEMRQSRITNANKPKETKLAQADRVNMETFMRDMLQILPLVGVQAFQNPVVIKNRTEPVKKSAGKLSANNGLFDMVVVPAKEEGFKRVFLGENRWRAIRIARKYLDRIKYICAYQSAPISAVTYWAEVEKIERYGDKGKYQLFFRGKAHKMKKPLKYEAQLKGWMQGPKYTNFEKFNNTKTLKDLFFWKKWKD